MKFRTFVHKLRGVSLALGATLAITGAAHAETNYKVGSTPTGVPFTFLNVDTNKIDIIAAAMYATPSRAEVVAFSDKVYSYGEGLIVKKYSDAAYKSFDDMEGLTIGVQVGTAYVKPLTDSGKFKEIKIYDSLADIMRDVALGRIVSDVSARGTDLRI